MEGFDRIGGAGFKGFKRSFDRLGVAGFDSKRALDRLGSTGFQVPLFALFQEAYCLLVSRRRVLTGWAP